MGKLSLLNKIFAIWYLFFFLLVGIILFYFGTLRISMGINTIRLSDPFTSHFIDVGLLYIQLSLIFLLVITIAITYLLTKRRK